MGHKTLDSCLHSHKMSPPLLNIYTDKNRWQVEQRNWNLEQETYIYTRVLLQHASLATFLFFGVNTVMALGTMKTSEWPFPTTPSKMGQMLQRVLLRTTSVNVTLLPQLEDFYPLFEEWGEEYNILITIQEGQGNTWAGFLRRTQLSEHLFCYYMQYSFSPYFSTYIHLQVQQ